VNKLLGNSTKKTETCKKAGMSVRPEAIILLRGRPVDLSQLKKKNQKLQKQNNTRVNKAF